MLFRSCSSCSSALLSCLQTHHVALSSVQSSQQIFSMSLSTTTMDLNRKPTVQHSVPLQARVAVMGGRDKKLLKYIIANLKLHLHSRNAIRTVLMTSSSILLLPSLMPHAQSIHYCCLELDDVIRDNKHAIAMMLYTRSTISRGSKAKNFTIMG